jgi:hypothetical protein
MAAWKEVDSFLVLQTPNGTACITTWANPSYWHGVITYADGRVEYVPPTDHFASQRHMEDIPNLPDENHNTGARFEGGGEAAKAFCEWKLNPPKSRRRTAWARIAK